MPAVFKFRTRRRNVEINTGHHAGKGSVLKKTPHLYLAKTGGFHVINIKRFSCWKMNKWMWSLASLSGAVQRVHLKSFHFLRRAALSFTALQPSEKGSLQSWVPLAAHTALLAAPDRLFKPWHQLEQPQPPGPSIPTPYNRAPAGSRSPAPVPGREMPSLLALSTSCDLST